MRSTATQGLACNFDIFNPDFDYEGANKILEEVEEMREYWNGKFYPLTKASTEENVWCAFQLSLVEKGAAYVFCRDNAEENSITLSFRGIDTGRKYSVSFSDENLCMTESEYSGLDLKNGIRIEIPEKRGSVLLRYNAK